MTQRYGKYVAGEIDVVLLVYETDPLTCPKAQEACPGSDRRACIEFSSKEESLWRSQEIEIFPAQKGQLKG